MNEDQKAFVDQLKYGQSFMLDGKRIDPKDIYMDEPQLAAELRRLHQVNQELVEVAEMAAGIGLHTLPDRPKCGCSQCDMVNAARAALAKLKEMK